MPIIDANLRLSNGQAITNNFISQNVLNLSAIRNVGVGKVPYIVSIVTTQLADSGNNSNCTVYWQTDAYEAMNSATNTRTVGVFATNAPVGTKLGPIAISPGEANEQYGAAYYSMGGGDMSGGNVTTFITFDPEVWTAYPDNVTISLP
jgi:hypothetical protein